MELRITYDSWTTDIFTGINLIYKGEKKINYFPKWWKISEIQFQLINCEGSIVSNIKLAQNWFGYGCKLQVNFKNTFHFYKKLKGGVHYIAKISSKETYTIIQHLGSKLSIYLNGDQIGLINEKMMRFDSYQYLIIKLNNNVDLEAISLLLYCYTICNPSDSDGFTLDLGYIGPQLKRIDSKWTPNSEQ